MEGTVLPARLAPPALHLGEQHLWDFCFDLGFYLTDYSSPPYLPLFNCFFFLLPSLLTLFFFHQFTPRVLSHPSPSARTLCPHSPLLPTPPSCPFTALLLSSLQNPGNKDCDVQYAELDTSALAASPSPRSSIHAGGDLVEYATIQPNLR